MHSLLTPGDGVVIGVSGGPDSVCLLHILLDLREELGLHLHVAHLHHGARGAEADADAEFVASLTAKWDLPLTLEEQDIPALARQHRLAFEETARRARYGFLAGVAEEIGASKIAVGHNADDQAETVLMHFVRGAGPAGLRGMLPLTPIWTYRLLDPFWKQEAGRGERQGSANGPRGDPRAPACAIVRPLLDVTRSEIEQYCAEHDLAPRFDRSNLDTAFFRNHLRLEVLPLLEATAPNIRTRLCHTAAIVAADYETLRGLRDQAWADVVEEERAAAIVFDRVAWKKLPVALQRATLRHATCRLRRSLRDVSFINIEQARQVGMNEKTGAQATLPMGLVLTVGYHTLTVGAAGDPGPPPAEPLMWGREPLRVQVPGVTQLPESEWALQINLLEGRDVPPESARHDRWTVYVDSADLVAPVVLRSRRQGDRFRPSGMGRHTVKLSAFMINRKIPRAWRDRVPLLVADGEIIWVCGCRAGAVSAIGPGTREVAQLRFDGAGTGTQGT